MAVIMDIPIDEKSEMNPQAQSLADGLLLERFVRSGNQDAFAALMNRHGPYILRVCRHLTMHAEDAEDVYQACFLELVRKAPSIRERGSRLAGQTRGCCLVMAREPGARPAARETARPALEPLVPPEDISWREACRILHEEIARLPEDLRLLDHLVLVPRPHSGRSRARDGHQSAHGERSIAARPRGAPRSSLAARRHAAGPKALLSAGSLEAAVPAALGQMTLQGAVAVANKTALTGIVALPRRG